MISGKANLYQLKTYRTLAIGLLVSSLFVTALGVRIYGAWCFRNSHLSDSCIVGLMAKHMAEGREMPVFYYGQAYMGSLEPAVSSIFVRVLGSNGFAVGLGTVLLSVLSLVFVWLLARRAGGEVGGLVALAFAAVAPAKALAYQVAPRGGYGAALLFAFATLWMAVELAIRKKAFPSRNEPIRMLCLGLFAGLGWWSNQLVIAAMLAAGIILLLSLRQRVFQRDTFIAAAGFFLGGAPFWIWNFRNDWNSFSSMAGGIVNVGAGLKQLFSVGLANILSLDNGPTWLAASILALLSLSVVVVLVCAIRTRNSARRTALIAVMLFIAASAFMFSIYPSPVIPSRYLLLAVPAIGICLGVLADAMAKRSVLRFGLVALLLVVVLQVKAVRSFEAVSVYTAGALKQSQHLAESLRSKNIDTVYIRYGAHGLNFVLDEEFCFNAIDRECYAPYSLQADLADDIAVLDNAGRITEFVAATRGKMKAINTQAGQLQYNISRADESVRPYSAYDVVKRISMDGIDVTSKLTDSDLDTSLDHMGNGVESLIVQFKEPVDLCGLRLVARQQQYPQRWQIFGRMNTNAEWKAMSDPIALNAYFWSGPRPFPKGAYHRQECRFPGHAVTELRIELGTEAYANWRISEMHFMGPAGSLVPRDGDALTKLAQVIKARNIKRIYCDRWEGAQLMKMNIAGLKVEMDPYVIGDSHPADRMMLLDSGSAILCSEACGLLCREAIEKNPSMHLVSEHTIGPWQLLLPQMNHNAERPMEKTYLAWRGFALFRAFRRERLADMFGRTRSSAELDEAHLRTILEDDSSYQPAISALAKLYRATGSVAKAGALEDRITPEIDAAISFANGIELLGVSIDPKVVRPGETLTVRYFWNFPEDIERDATCMFVHFVNEKNIVFQDDHAILQRVDLAYQRFKDEVFVEKRQVRVPANAALGKYEIRTGLWGKHDPSRRLKPRTGLAQKRRAVIVPDVMVVQD